MNSKKVNWLFLSILLIDLLVIGLLWMVELKSVQTNTEIFTLSMTMNLICSEMVILVPTLLWLLFSKVRIKEVLPFHKIKAGTVFMLILFTYLMMPLVTTINAVTMLFTDNVVTEMSGAILNMPFFLVVFLMGCFGPMCEEVVFRGVVYQGYKTSQKKIGAILLSAFLFGCMHLNLNQMPYAFVIGIILAILIEATGSLWAPILVHTIFNVHNVIMMFVTNKITPLSNEAMAEGQELLNDMDMMLVMISVLMIVAAVTTTLAVCVLIWIIKHEDRSAHMKELFTKRSENSTSLLSLPLFIALVLCFGYMAFDLVMRWIPSSAL